MPVLLIVAPDYLVADNLSDGMLSQLIIDSSLIHGYMGALLIPTALFEIDGSAAGCSTGVASFPGDSRCSLQVACDEFGAAKPTSGWPGSALF